MEYLMLIYSNEARWAAMSEAEQEAIMAQHYAVLDKAQKDGTYLGGNRLLDTPTATTIRNHNGKVSVTDGPFAETKEQLGGYYHFKTDDIDQVIGYASMLEYGDHGAVEIRPVFEYE